MISSGKQLSTMFTRIVLLNNSELAGHLIKVMCTGQTIGKVAQELDEDMVI